MEKREAIVTQLSLCRPHKGYDAGDISSQPVDRLALAQDGIVGDRHYGAHIQAGGRQTAYAAKGLPLVNIRQVSVVSGVELRAIANLMKVPNVTGSDVGANIVLEGIANITSFPAGVNGILRFPSGLILYCMGENEPCDGPGKVIAAQFGRPELANKFQKAAMHRRGIVAMVGHPGHIELGDAVELFYPGWSIW